MRPTALSFGLGIKEKFAIAFRSLNRTFDQRGAEPESLDAGSDAVARLTMLGRIAHDAWLKAAGWWGKLPPRQRPPFAHGATAQLPDGITLLSSYHPSRQNTNTGKLTREMWYAVFGEARRLLK